MGCAVAESSRDRLLSMPDTAMGLKMFSLWEKKTKLNQTKTSKQKGISFWTCHTDKQVYMGYPFTLTSCTESLIGIL